MHCNMAGGSSHQLPTHRHSRAPTHSLHTLSSLKHFAHIIMSFAERNNWRSSHFILLLSQYAFKRVITEVYFKATLIFFVTTLILVKTMLCMMRNQNFSAGKNSFDKINLTRVWVEVNFRTKL